MNADYEKSIYRMAMLHHWAVVIIGAGAGYGLVSKTKLPTWGKIAVGVGVGIGINKLDPFGYKAMHEAKEGEK